MKNVNYVVCDDGTLHTSEQKAKKHLDKVYTNIICALSATLCSADKYQDIKEVLDSADFQSKMDQALKIKTEMKAGIIEGEEF